MSTGDPQRPLPVPVPWDQGYWHAAAQHRLVVQRCGACGLVRSLPRLRCPDCHSAQASWINAAGTGRIYSWTALHRRFHPAFADLPFVVAIVELDDHRGVHLVTDMPGVDETTLHIGQPVRVGFVDIAPGVTLPRFLPSPGTADHTDTK